MGEKKVKNKNKKCDEVREGNILLKPHQDHSFSAAPGSNKACFITVSAVIYTFITAFYEFIMLYCAVTSSSHCLTNKTIKEFNPS